MTNAKKSVDGAAAEKTVSNTKRDREGRGGGAFRGFLFKQLSVLQIPVVILISLLIIGKTIMLNCFKWIANYTFSCVFR